MITVGHFYHHHGVSAIMTKMRVLSRSKILIPLGGIFGKLCSQIREKSFD